MNGDDQGPMQDARSTRDVMKAAPANAPDKPDKPDAPETPATDAATRGVKTDQEAG